MNDLVIKKVTLYKNSIKTLCTNTHGNSTSKSLSKYSRVMKALGSLSIKDCEQQDGEKEMLLRDWFLIYHRISEGRGKNNSCTQRERQRNKLAMF